MAITSELIGKLGGVDVETIPVSAPEGDHLLCSLDLEEDKTYLVGVTGVSSDAPGVIYAPKIYIGNSISGYGRRKNDKWSVAGIVSGPVEVRLDSRSNTGINAANFDGVVFVVDITGV